MGGVDYITISVEVRRARGGAPVTSARAQVIHWDWKDGQRALGERDLDAAGRATIPVKLSAGAEEGLDLSVSVRDARGTELVASETRTGVTGDEHFLLTLPEPPVAGADGRWLLPRKIRMLVFAQDSGRALRGVPLRLVIEVQGEAGLHEIAVGTLIADHVGYAAFDLSETLATLGQSRARVDQRGIRALTHFWCSRSVITLQQGAEP